MTSLNPLSYSQTMNVPTTDLSGSSGGGIQDALQMMEQLNQQLQAMVRNLASAAQQQSGGDDGGDAAPAGGSQMPQMDPSSLAQDPSMSGAGTLGGAAGAAGG
ncbi:type III effector HrpK, partial [Burkholderia gladioli]|nr:type III effector HrpK [Burkholderia gladioli]